MHISMKGPFGENFEAYSNIILKKLLFLYVVYF